MFKVIAGYSIVFFLLIPLTDLFALDTLKIVNGKEDYLVDGPFMQLLVDKSKKLTINDVSSPAFSAQFKNKGPEYPREDLDAAYWTRFYVRNESDYNKWLLEIVDPHINHIEIYMEDSSGNFIKSTTGNYLPFLHREYIHKNFVYDLNVPPSHSGFRKYYVRMESENTFALFYNIRSNRYFGRYALNEYYLLGMYYGMILVMALYNLLMFFTFREKAYIFYVLYVLTGGMMSLLEDGTGFEYIWPSHPGVNQWIYIFAPILFLIFFTLYAKSFLEVRRQDERLNKIINISLILYFCYLLIDLFISPKPPVFAVFIIPFVIMFIAAIMVFLKGYRPARYFIVGYSFVIISFFLYLLRINGLLGPGDPLSVYVFNYGLIFEIVIFSVAMSDRVRIIKMEKESAQKKMIEQLVENEKLIDKTNKELETKVEARTMEINKKSKDITDSITYAKRLQEAILPDERIAGMILKEHFIMYIPKAIVSGDFYWIHQKGNIVMVAAVDCTGHGVPGGFMSILAHNILNQVVKEMGLSRPGQILTEVNKRVNETLSTSNDFMDGEYGMDIALIALDRDKMEVQYAGAYNPLYIIRKGELMETRADRMSIGNTSNGIRNYFTNHVIKVEQGDMLYIFSDGFADQFGGPQRRKFMLGTFNKLLMEIHQESMSAQKETLTRVFHEWKDGYDQIDDILVMGIRVS